MRRETAIVIAVLGSLYAIATAQMIASDLDRRAPAGGVAAQGPTAGAREFPTEGGPASAPENGAPAIGWLHPKTAIYAESAREFDALMAAHKAREQVDWAIAKAEADAMFAGYVKTTWPWPGGEVTWNPGLARTLGIDGVAATDVIVATGGSLQFTNPGDLYVDPQIYFFGHPVDRVEVDPKTGRLTIYAEVAPVESRR